MYEQPIIPPTDTLARDISFPLYNAKFWLKLVGILSIVYGALLAITIIGIIVAWLPIWLGILMFQTGKSIEAAFNNNDKAALMKAMNDLKTYFTIQGILALIGIIGLIVYVLVIGSILGSVLGSGKLSGL